ncbi:16S rRNA (cytidine(1402)-2'-O)-methyltransferase [Pelagibacteraceae bacterium]|nr:16S rRNA (cytidine(1402)-2'-O)-methyltransferase [Pelagibacteraceae bacterium]
MNNVTNSLSIVATPIGNLEDISYRAVSILKECDIIICENPKHSLKLLNKLGIKKKLFALHDYNEEKIIAQIESLLQNKNCALISDAGSPLISDPGYNLIQYCIKNKIRITSIPGPSSIISSLQLSGLPLSEFTFFGFVPKSKNKLEDLIKQLSKEKRTSVLFVSNHKLLIFIEMLEKFIPERSISICKELTKINEFVFRGVSSKVKKDILQKKENLKGEFVAVVNGETHKKHDFEDIELYRMELKKMVAKFSLTDIVEIVHKFTKINKNKIYKWLLDLKRK